MEIRLATFEEIVNLRWRILRAGLPKESAHFPGDYDPTTLHIAAIDDEAGDQVIACATFMQNQYNNIAASQLRGMAVDDGYRSQGIGEQILIFADEQILQHGYALQFWCNARKPAVRFYQRLGWKTDGEEFDIPTAGPHFKMTRVLSAQP